MQLKTLDAALTVCKVASFQDIDTTDGLFFIGQTDEELSLVCRTREVPTATIAREDGWRGFRVAGTLDFSLVGILARISSLLADNGISLFAVSTYNTDYVLIREPQFEHAMAVLKAAGYEVG